MTDLTLNSLFSVEGKVAVVTGGSRGIGEMVAAGLLRLGRVGGVAIGVQRDDLKPARGKGPGKGAPCRGAGFHRGHVEMRPRGPAAGIHLDPLDTQPGSLIQHFVECQPAKAVRHEPDFHRMIPL